MGQGRLESHCRILIGGQRRGDFRCGGHVVATQKIDRQPPHTPVAVLRAGRNRRASLRRANLQQSPERVGCAQRRFGGSGMCGKFVDNGIATRVQSIIGPLANAVVG